jgi:hypothetical protein
MVSFQGVLAGSRVLAAFVPRDATDDAVAAAGKEAQRPFAKLPLRLMGYFVMAMAFRRRRL